MAQDEELEIVFWWMGGDSQHAIEDGLDDYLLDAYPYDTAARRPAARRRRLPWPGRRTATARP